MGLVQFAIAFAAGFLTCLALAIATHILGVFRPPCAAMIMLAHATNNANSASRNCRPAARSPVAGIPDLQLTHYY